MDQAVHPIRTVRRRYFGLALCVLTLLFSVVAKAAPYNPGHQESKGLTATKIWQDEAPRSEARLPLTALVPALLGTLLAIGFASTTVFLLCSDEYPVREHAWFASYLLVRPPPSF